MNKKTYRLNICESSYLQFTEEEFEKLTDMVIELPEGTKIQGKRVQIKSDTLKYDLLVITPVDNFEVVYEPSL